MENKLVMVRLLRETEIQGLLVAYGKSLHECRNMADIFSTWEVGDIASGPTWPHCPTTFTFNLQKVS